MHTITIAECNSRYVNLKDDEGLRYGEKFPPDKTRYVVVDDQGRETFASQRGVNQIWGALGTWFTNNEIKPGTLIQVDLDSNAIEPDGSHVLKLSIIERPEEAREPERREQSSATESEVRPRLEQQLEDFVETNLGFLEDGLTLYVDSSGKRGRQYDTNSIGTIDLLCKAKNGDLVVMELKRDKTSDVVVGQILRYMGWVKANLAQKNEVVRGIILAHEYDERLRYATDAVGGVVKVMRYRMKLEFLA